MARTRRIKKTECGETYYHLMSRTNDRRFLFRKAVAKDALVDILRRTAEFSGIDLKAYTMMDNHFHIVCKVSRDETEIPESEILRRVAALKGVRFAENLREHWGDLRKIGNLAAYEEALRHYRLRMNDISEFIKTFKETFNIWYKRFIAEERHVAGTDPADAPYSGGIWEGRFKSTIIQDGEYLARCCRYVVLNPVRARIVGQVKDYRWSCCESEAVGVSSGGDDIETTEGGRLLKRIAQIGAGKIFGSREYVMSVAFALGDRFRTKTVGAHQAGENGYSTHGWRLAERAA